MSRRNKVYIPNNSGHDFSKAEEYGELVYITSGLIDKYGVNKMFRQASDKMADSSRGDYIMITGLPVLNSIVTSVFTSKHNCLNLLIYDIKTEEYVPRNIILEDQI